jgi:LPXTG-motif cell wall-anchored protein
VPGAIAALTMLALVALASPAGAQYPPDAPSVGTPSSAIANGSTTTVSGSGWLAGSTVSLTIASTPQSLGTATVADDGTFSREVTIPCVEPGDHTITASGTAANGGARSTATTISVTGACDATGSLPRTGSDSGSLLTLVAVLLIAGAVLVVATTRRRAATSR